MVSAKWACLYVFALSLVPSFASADESPVETVRQQVEKQLVKPLTEKENQVRRFSRARPVPRERRARVTDTTPKFDKDGRQYVAFAVDIRVAGGEWTANDVVGCAYPRAGALFVKIGDAYRPASFLLGEDVAPVVGVCTPAPRA